MFASIARRCNVVVIVSILLLSFLIIMTACGSTATPSNPSAATTPTATPTDTPTSTPTANVSAPLSSDAAKQVFTQMATAIKNKDYATLYNMTSSEYQAKHPTQQQMIDDIQRIIYAPNSDGTDVVDFGIGTVSIGNRAKDTATVADGGVSYTFANGHIAGTNPSLIAENGQWKIADFLYHQMQG